MHLSTLAVIAALLIGTLPVVYPSAHAQTVHPKGTTIWKTPKTEFGLTFFYASDRVSRLIAPSGRVIKEWGSPEMELGTMKPVFDGLGHILAMSDPIPIPGYFLGTRASRLKQLDAMGNIFFEWDTPTLSKGEFGGLHHDMERLNNGNTLVLCSTLVDVPEISPNKLIDDCLVELDWAGNVVWEWYTHEHFDEFGFTEEAKRLIAETDPDWAHANSLSIIPPNDHADPAFTPGNIMVSYRDLNTIIVIDKSTGNIVWKYGPDESEVIGQHGPYMIELGMPGAGNILVFDNGFSAGYPPDHGHSPGLSRSTPLPRKLAGSTMHATLA